MSNFLIRKFSAAWICLLINGHADLLHRYKLSRLKFPATEPSHADFTCFNDKRIAVNVRKCTAITLKGNACAEFCLASYKPSAMISGWAPMPDCNEPETVDQFLKLSLMPQSDGPSAQQLIDDSVLVDQTGDGGGYRAPISQALIGPSYSGRLGRKPSSAQQNTFYSSRTGAEFKGHNQLLKNRKWKKRINGSKPLASALSMPRWYFV
ncbi:uncharacterized protein LOC116928259 [Daphnia magna]|uniref:uncharacterized protein LOC116928259 n=1 Tax=Daphnia magna TaxID=35525 RepID=UPI001E1BB42A|nr:uncharacterized protein LOC116928259 [Daphnia magna]